MKQLEKQKTLLDDFFGGRLDEVIEDSSDYPMLLMVIGEKEAALTMNADEEQIKTLKEFAEAFDLHLRVYKGRTSKPGKPGAENPSFDQKGVFLATEEDRFDILENSEGRFYGFSDEAVGKFLGFPKSSIKFFNSTEQPGLESRSKINKLKESEEFERDMNYLNLTTYIPAPERDAVKEAIKTGIKREKALIEFDEENNVNIGKKYLEERFSSSFY